MERSPSWESNRSLANHEIPGILWNPKVHYRIHNSSLPVPILSHTNPVHAPPSYVWKIHFNIILISTPMFFRWLLISGFPNQTPVSTSPVSHTCHIPRPSHSSWFGHPNNIWPKESIMFALTNWKCRLYRRESAEAYGHLLSARPHVQICSKGT